MNVAVIGSRAFNNRDYVFRVLDRLRKTYGDITVISGGATGADTLAEQWAKQRGLRPIVFPAKWDDLSHPDALVRVNKKGRKYDARAGMRRNKDIINLAHMVIAFMDPDSPTPGTSNSISLAKAKGVPVYVFYPGKKWIKK